MKKCTKCGIEKPLSEFNKNKSRKDGLGSHCKACIGEQYQQNKKKVAEYQRSWYQKNKKKQAKYDKQYREKNYDSVREYQQDYYEENKEKILSQRKEYRLQNHKKISKYSKVWYQKNKEKQNAYGKNYRTQKAEGQPACIYQITNQQNGKIYIGETLQGKIRWKKHLSSLKGGYHKNRLLQEDFDKLGEEVFEWEILKEFPKDKETLLLEEARTISRFLKQDRDLYNLTLTIEQLKLLQENGE
jgi:hypothetical protein